MKNTGLFVILIFRRKTFEKSTCFLLAGLLICLLNTIVICLQIAGFLHMDKRQQKWYN